VETSPDVANIVAAVSSSNNTATITTTMVDAPNLPISDSQAATSHTLLWPIAAHASIQPMSQKALATAIGLATTKLESTTEDHRMALPVSKTVGIQQSVTTTQSPAITLATCSGLRKGRFVAVKKSPSGATPLQCVISRAGGKSVPMPRCFILRPVCTMASATSLRLGTMTACRPNTQAVTATNKSVVENKQHILVPAVCTTVHQILMPTVIPRATFSTPASTSGCRVIRAKTVAVPRLQSPTASTSDSLQALPVIGSSASSQLTAMEDTRKDSPLSCIQTLVANAGAATQLIAIHNEIPDYNSSALSQADRDENDTILQLTVSASNRQSYGSTSTATDNTHFQQTTRFSRKRLSAYDGLENKVAKQS